jgi:hypothetical protein
VKQSLSLQSISSLRAKLSGRVIEPHDAEYEQARTIFLGGFDRCPALIVRPADAAPTPSQESSRRQRRRPTSYRSLPT